MNIIQEHINILRFYYTHTTHDEYGYIFSNQILDESLHQPKKKFKSCRNNDFEWSFAMLFSSVVYVPTWQCRSPAETLEFNH